MYRWLVVWQAAVLIVGGTMDMGLLNSRYAGSQLECFDYPTTVPFRSYDTGWNLPKKNEKLLQMTALNYWPSTAPGINILTRRVDTLWNRDDIVREHAKLVQDINSLRQVMFVAPLAEESRDYEDTIFPEIIETTTTTRRPPTTKPARPTKTGFPILLLGGSSRRHTTRNQPIKIPKKTISLVGTSSPIIKHPYPFVMAASSRHPVRICMSSPISYATTHRPSLWERLIRAILPR